MIPVFWVIRYVTLYTLVFGIFGESAQGSLQSEKTYDLFLVRHLPTLLPLLVLTYMTMKQRVWTTDKEKMISNIIIGLVGVIFYIVLEQSEILDS